MTVENPSWFSPRTLCRLRLLGFHSFPIGVYLRSSAVSLFLILLASLAVQLCLYRRASAADACPAAEIISPAQGSFVAHPRPAIEWRALPGASRYRLQLESRVPEGRVLARFDSVVAGTRFVPPANLADSRAAVKLLITADCGAQAPSVTENAAWFFMDLSALCPAPAEILVNAAPGPVVTWQPVKQALRYEVSVFTAAEGRLLAKAESVEPRFRFSTAPAAPYYVALRARCAEAYSAPVYRVVTPAR